MYNYEMWTDEIVCGVSTVAVGSKHQTSRVSREHHDIKRSKQQSLHAHCNIHCIAF